jgi:hypothetical protein
MGARSQTLRLRQRRVNAAPTEELELIIVLRRLNPPSHTTLEERRAWAQGKFQDDWSTVANFIEAEGGQVLQTSWTGRAGHCRTPASAIDRLIQLHPVRRLALAKASF